MGCQRIEVQVQAITGEKGDTARGQHLSERVNEQMRHVLRSRAELKHRKNLREGINGQPEPQHMLGAPEPCS